MQANTKIIVTGGAGFIGSTFTKLCLDKGHQVLVIDKLTYAANKRSIDSRAYFIQKDICDVTVDEVNGYDYIVNFAAETHVDNSIADGRPFIRSNVEGVFNLLEVSRNSNIKKFIQISTDEVYGDIESGISDEGYPLKPSSYYSATKASADMLVLSANRTYGLPYIITRTCNNFGRGQHPEKFIPKMVQRYVDGEAIPLYTPGTQIREWIWVEDNCNAIYNIMTSDKVNEIYNIGSGDRHTNKEIIEKFKTDAKIELVPDRLGHDYRYALDSQKYDNEWGTPVTQKISEFLSVFSAKYFGF